MKAPERVLTTINHEEPDRVPAWESAFTSNTITKHYGMKPGKGDYGISMLKKVPNKDEVLKSFLKQKNILKAGYKFSFELFRRIGLDIGTSITSLFPRKILDDASGFVDEYGRIMKFEYYEKDGTPIMGYYGGIFKSFEDYESWEDLDPNWEARLNGFLAGREVQKEMKDEIFSVPATGALMECTWEGFGIETFSRILSRPKQAKKVFDDRGKFTLELVKILAENNAQMVILWDDYGFKNGLFMSPLNYRKYVFPWIKQICDAAHKLDCKILLHSDGDLMQIFEDIIKSGADVLNPIESTTANPDYDIFKLNEKYGDKITFCGNLSPIMLAMGKISEIEAYAKRLIKEIAPGGGYIFSSGHSINPAVTIDRFEAMQNIKRKYGTYPIKNIPD
ncbi:MAG: uroporphyrinogen decarboxylase family protein [Promethearchaeota archaeon]